MALFTKRDANVPLLTRVCQVEDKEIPTFALQLERPSGAGAITNPDKAKETLLLFLAHNGTGTGGVKWGEFTQDDLLKTYEAEIEQFKILRSLTLDVMGRIADAPPGADYKELLRDLTGALNAQVGKLKPVLLCTSSYPQNQEDGGLPRNGFYLGYGDEAPGFQANYFIRHGLLTLLGEGHTLPVRRCPVCRFPYVVTRTGQTFCSVRCRTRNSVAKNYRKNKMRNFADD